jgi:hypothetical protein
MWKVPADKLSTNSAHSALSARRGSKQLVTPGRACPCALMRVLLSLACTLSAQTPTNVRGLAHIDMVQPEAAGLFGPIRLILR